MIVDASVWVSYFIHTDVNYATSVAWLERIIASGETLAAPALLPVEVAGAVVRRSGDSSLGLEAAEALRDLPCLGIVPLDDELLHLCEQTAATLSVKGADAVYIATAQLLNVPLVTWDTEQKTRGGVIATTHSPADLL